MRKLADYSADLHTVAPGGGLIEDALIAQGERVVCGVDESGRGPLAGPVVAAAVIFRDCGSIRQARDSKSLTARQRERHFERLTAETDYAVGIGSVAEIEEQNILRATLRAMARAIAELRQQPTLVLVDGNRAPAAGAPVRCMIGGDRYVATISAASIIAKVTRDRIMAAYHEEYPQYGFNRHAGYPTFQHRRALQEFGPCPIHRRTFHGVCAD